MVIQHKRLTRSVTRTVCWENSDDTNAACQDEHQTDEADDTWDDHHQEQYDEDSDSGDDLDDGQTNYDAEENTAEDHDYGDADRQEDDNESDHDEEKSQICAPRKNHGPYQPFGG